MKQGRPQVGWDAGETGAQIKERGSKTAEREINEMDIGLRGEEVATPEIGVGEYERFLTGELDYVVPEGESFNQSSIRMMGCLEELARQHAGQQIVIVSHGGVLGAVLRHVLRIIPETRHRFKRFNGSWNVFTFENGAWFLETWGDISHLQQTQSLRDEG